MPPTYQEYVTRPNDGTYRRRPTTTASAHFLPDETERPPFQGAAVFKFPLDDISAGNFWTHLAVNSWEPVPPKKEIVAKQTHRLKTTPIAHIWLPMPLVLSTGYNQKYTETDNMMVNRGSGVDVGDFGTWYDHLVKGVKGAVNELGEGWDSVTSVNNSGKMNKASIWNQQLGLTYDGPSLRAHTFSWRMTPKNQAEQDAIQQIVFALKAYSSPIVKNIAGDDVNFHTSVQAIEATTVKAVANNPEVADETASEGDDEAMRNLGRIGIPATIKVEFWYGDEINPHLFQVGHSFITSVEVNYTPTGTWNAYEDGAPIETQITLGLKENVIVAQHQIKNSGGF